MINIVNMANIQVYPQPGFIGPTLSFAFQNFFQGETYEGHRFASFSVQGATSQLNGENETLALLFPFSSFALSLVESGNGNKLSNLTLKTRWVETNSTSPSPSSANYLTMSEYTSYYIGVGASYSETTIELRFKSAMDGVNGAFPASTFTRRNSGQLPANSRINFK